MARPKKPQSFRLRNGYPMIEELRAAPIPLTHYSLSITFYLPNLRFSSAKLVKIRVGRP